MACWSQFLKAMDDIMSTVERAAVARRGRWLQALTIAWNSAECLVALSAGFLAGSIALVGSLVRPPRRGRISSTPAGTRPRPT